MPVTPAEALAGLGFTGLESEIYAFLLGESPATGYRIAQGIGKPVANTYKAIQSLEAKGAISVDEEGSRMCRAVPVEDVMSRIARDFERRRADALQALTSLGGKRESERIYSLKSRDQVLQQANALISGAQKQIWGVVSPSFASALGPAIRTQNVENKVRTLSAELPEDTTDLHEKWPGEVLILVADGQQCLFALLDRWANVVQASWTRGAFLALLLQEGLSASATLRDIAEQLEEGAGPKRIGRALAGFESGVQSAGFQALSEELL